MAPVPSFATLVALLLAASSVSVVAAPATDTEALGTKTVPQPAAAQRGFRTLNDGVKDPVPSAYIAVYKKSVSDGAVAAHQAQVAHSIARRNLERRRRRRRSKTPPGEDDSAVSEKETTSSPIQINTFRALALAHADDETMTTVYQSPEIDYVEQDSVMHACDSATQQGAPSGLSRLSHAEVDPLSGYTYDNTAGYGITAYVIDSGIQLNHTDFQGRAVWGMSAVDSLVGDDNGHGTLVAGVLGGRTFGVAKNVALVSVRIIDRYGNGTFTSFFQGLEWMYKDTKARNLTGRAVASVGTIGARNQATNDAVTSLVNAGIVFVAPAGNDGTNATALMSPASAPDSITVSAINQTTDERAFFGNYGPEVTVFAAGIDVASTYIGPSTYGAAYASGTSFSAPHVAGLAAYLMRYEGIQDPRAVKRRIIELAGYTGASVLNNGPNTTGLIANNGHM
ncbi:serine protease [Sporothrix curviconia]|uniref:Serine protease n=1 Tax=Sporothrix curviconia TaxID=1260050 RepID=A0ABP0AY93_9PEZI